MLHGLYDLRKGMCPDNSYMSGLWFNKTLFRTLNFEFHVIFTCHKISFFIVFPL